MGSERRPSLAQLSAQIRSLAQSGKIFFTTHAMEEMAKDGLDLADMLAAIGTGRIVELQPNDRYRVEGRTSDGIAVVAICQLQETIKAGRRVFVITVWKAGTR